VISVKILGLKFPQYIADIKGLGLIISYRNSHHIKGAELKIKAEVKHQNYIGFSQ